VQCLWYFSIFNTYIVQFLFLLKCNFRQSWTKVLTHFSKTKAFYRRPSVIKKTFFVDSQTPLSSTKLKYAPLTLLRGYNIKKGSGGQNVKIGDWKTQAFNKTGLFRGVSQLLLSMIVDLAKPKSGAPEFWFEFCNFTLRFSVYTVQPSVLSWRNVKLHKAKAVVNF